MMSFHHESEFDEMKMNYWKRRLSYMWRQKMKEDSVSVVEKIYFPNTNCSMLISKTEHPSGSDQTNVQACIKCCGPLCIDCKVPSHYDLSCADYKNIHNESKVDDMILKCLADDNGWRQITKSMHKS
ncbi:E3 ubiquitin-protein ligase RSL1 [Cardamine amara subsp. amara]|uniref:E3 ubiquitin-protein ligase RSL1 n=1 Tax=Cardamine amara subsp. amara TaxID=228776 RepID=A0ABD1B8D8_CARAN